MRERLEALKGEAVLVIGRAQSLDELRETKIKYLGKKGELTRVLRGMGSLPPEERPVIGSLANDIRGCLDQMIAEKEKQLEEASLLEQLHKEVIDVTLPGIKPESGTLHPLQLIIEQVEDIFVGMGFEIAEGPEVETDQYNFEALNLPKGHPARDMQDSFYINPEILLRTHTSSVQIRTLIEKEGSVPVRIICPGKVYRRDDDDATHSHQFTQIEGLVVDRGVSMSELNGVLLTLIEKMFGEGTEMRLRPSYFPFTEPSLEVDIFHPEQGWVEILGAGMVHPRVLENTGYNPERYTGFAFGIGVERIAMLKYGIDDIRHFYNNDLRFLRQFKTV
ncbi:phenylalanine--tRNA ligase subunit alpha [Thermoactinomyces mirandus]|uniref:Phenylalanine--tRNA ligase alpha subunit n=1 Tax=Thermoactinomyces mirandus TaxID=2756294 RepID=A0A7W2ARK4_9BACL|nr:phenylalanine--tRNA ligase subunit alpha [Thermoactinomyces mirandus]MBA4601670.1 phenylalanine--tRNA ligase subunit alpha [Thermoactinomyces mirandus]